MGANGEANGNNASYTVPFVIGGKDHYPEATFDVVSPSSGKVVHRCSSASVADAEAAVQAAAEALPSWKKTTLPSRRDILLKAARILERRKDEIVGYHRDETGASKAWAEANIGLTIDILSDSAVRVMGLDGGFPATADANTSCISMREPYGVILSIAPWNAPLILGARALVYPIAAGNTVVFKATEAAPRTMWSLVSVLQEAGLPAGVVNCICAEPAAASAVTTTLIKNPHVRKINFTGSTAIGRVISKLAGEQLKPVLLELGGKAPAIVWEDADLDVAAKQCALGAFLNAGQICMSTERIIVHRAVKQRFQERFAAVTEAIFSSSAEAPVLVDAKTVDKNKKLIHDATAKGASVVYGSLDTKEISETRLRPIILDGVTPDMDLYYTESFGPTVSLIEVDSEDEALRVANDTEYGLSAAVFTRDLRRGLRFARGIESGAVHINSMTVHDEPALPHGGVKASGFGRFNSAKGIEEWVWLKSVTFDN